jgi:hypothetical protein
MPPHKTKIVEFLFGEWSPPGYVSKKCFKVNEGGKVSRAKNCEYKYGYEGDVTNGIYLSKVTINNLTRSDMKTYGIDVELGIYRIPLQYWFNLQMFGKISWYCFGTTESQPSIICFCVSFDHQLDIFKRKLTQIVRRAAGMLACKPAHNQGLEEAIRPTDF